MAMGWDGSDWGFYGLDGEFSCERLPVPRCRCLCGPVLHCEYDDTPGFRETVYRLRCDRCKVATADTSVLENVITEWNTLMSNNATR